MARSNDSDGKPFSWDDHFLGSVTIGERGQVVIPVEARKRFGLEAGDRLLVMADPARRCVMLCRMDDLRGFMNAFQAGLERVEREVDATKEDAATGVHDVEEDETE